MVNGEGAIRFLNFALLDPWLRSEKRPCMAKFTTSTCNNNTLRLRNDATGSCCGFKVVDTFSQSDSNWCFDLQQV